MTQSETSLIFSIISTLIHGSQHSLWTIKQTTNSKIKSKYNWFISGFTTRLRIFRADFIKVAEEWHTFCASTARQAAELSTTLFFCQQQLSTTSSPHQPFVLWFLRKHFNFVFFLFQTSPLSFQFSDVNAIY